MKMILVINTMFEIYSLRNEQHLILKLSKGNLIENVIPLAMIMQDFFYNIIYSGDIHY